MSSLIFNLIFINESDEYKKVGPAFGQFMFTFRLSLGDFDFSTLGTGSLSTSKEVLFWVIWCFMVFKALLIMLNFIIAEVSNSYEVVKENIDVLIYKERAGLIHEAESITPRSFRASNKLWFPQYIIAREADQ